MWSRSCRSERIETVGIGTNVDYTQDITIYASSDTDFVETVLLTLHYHFVGILCENRAPVL